MLTDELKIELEDICTDNGLTIDFNFDYPIRITVRKSMQVNLFEDLPNEAYLRFKFNIDQIDFDFIGDFRLDDKIFSKLLNKFKKLHYIYLQEWYSQKENRFKNGVKPMWGIVNGGSVAIVQKWYKG